MHTTTARPSADPVTGTRHFVGLDGLRGVAALMVVVSHCLLTLGISPPNAYALAVDFFFMLSGFVVAHAYEAKLASGALPLGRFVAIRLVRLHPLLLLGTLVGVAAEFVLIAAGAVTPASPGRIAFALVAGMVCLPLARLPGSDGAFPLNNPQWSLFCEYVANLLFGLVARYLSTTLLAAVVILGFVALFALSLPQRSIFTGWSPENWPGGLVRIVYPFCAGLLLARLHHRGRLPERTWPWPALALLLLGTLCLGRALIVVQAIALLFVFPAILILGRAEQFPPRLSRLLLYLGAASYPLYILHYPIVLALAALLPHATPAAIATSLAVQLAAALIASHLALTAFDIPVRRRLGHRLRGAGGRSPHSG